MKILSLFDGMSCGQIALNRIGIKPDVYYAAEIDKYAIQVTQHNYPDTVQLGSVLDWQSWNIDWSGIDLVMGGFPCQAWSVAGKGLGDKDPRGALFWTFLDIIKNVLTHNPKAMFLMENVKMKREFEQYITHHTEQALGHVHKTLINSALVSAQSRQRYYWTNFEVTQPDDRGIILADILESEVSDFVCGAIRGRYIVDGKRQDYKMKTAGLTEQRLEVRKDGKTNTLTTVQKDNVVVSHSGLLQVGSIYAGNGDAGRIYHPDGKGRTLKGEAGGGGAKMGLVGYDNYSYRKLTPVECERLQTVPDNFTDCVSNTQRYRMLGNGWTVDVIAHILSKLKGLCSMSKAI
jgi:DNA (cytosine-5)-methyltransferase 1/DNA (cytosine-5)-methyltransferase 3A